MAIVVEHEKRRREILQKSLDVFSEEGYEDVTFQKIADRCGITRTTLYIYFKNKREIFLWSIKQMTEGLEKDLIKVCSDSSLPASEVLYNALSLIIDCCEQNKQLFGVILEYLLQVKKAGGDPHEKVHRRVIHLRHFMTTIILRGMENGQFKKVPVKNINELFYSIIESAIFRLAVLNEDKLSETRVILKQTIESVLEVEE